ncbi:DUF177 domain-containing protein [Chloroflexota bacterium]
MQNNLTLLRINVGFLVNQAVGFSRNIPLEIPELSFADDLVIQNLGGKIVVSRTTEGLLVQVKGQALTGLECAYCLEDYQQNLQLDFVEMYTFPSHVVEDTELILPDDLQIDLAPLIREYLLLDIPIKPVCKSECIGLCPICGEKQKNTICNHSDEQIDPRLSVLKTLLDDENSASS